MSQEVTDGLPHIHNSDVPWDEFDANEYALHHYRRVSDADRRVATRIVECLAALPDTTRYDRAVGIGVASVLRGLCMIGPLLSPEAHVLLADNVPQQSATTAAAIAAVQAGQSTIWDAHAAAIAQANSRWGNVLQQLGGKHLSTGLHDILQAPLGQAGIRFEEHVLCSITNSPAEHEVAVRNFYDGMQPGDIAVRLFDVGSDGYYVSGISFPGLPLDAKQVSTQALRMGLDVLTAFEEPVESSLNDNTNAVGSTLRALGGAVLQMPLPTGAVS